MKISGFTPWLVGILSLTWATAQGGPALPREHGTLALGPESAPVRVSRSYGWKPLTPSRFVLWLGVEEPYLVDLAPGCPDLRTLTVQGITTHNRQLNPRIDKLVTSSGPCALAHLQRADRTALSKLGLRREDSQALPVLTSTNPPNPVK